MSEASCHTETDSFVRRHSKDQTTIQRIVRTNKQKKQYADNRGDALARAMALARRALFLRFVGTTCREAFTSGFAAFTARTHSARTTKPRSHHHTAIAPTTGSVIAGPARRNFGPRERHNWHCAW
jgi:hypothetical protein